MFFPSSVLTIWDDIEGTPFIWIFAMSSEFTLWQGMRKGGHVSQARCTIKHVRAKLIAVRWIQCPAMTLAMSKAKTSSHIFKNARCCCQLGSPSTSFTTGYIGRLGRYELAISCYISIPIFTGSPHLPTIETKRNEYNTTWFMKQLPKHWSNNPL